MSPVSAKFPAWLNDKMKQKGWSQSQLARQSKLSRQTISYWLSGNAKRPDEESLKKVARAFGVPPEEAYEAASTMTSVAKEDAWVREVMYKLDQLKPPQRKVAEWLIKKLAEDEPEDG